MVVLVVAAWVRILSRSWRHLIYEKLQLSLIGIDAKDDDDDNILILILGM